MWQDGTVVSDMGQQHSEVRISDADRQAVVAALTKSTGEGRLSLDELEERMAGAYAAKTYGDLEPLLRDLPGGAAAVLPPPTTSPSTWTAPANWSGAGTPSQARTWPGSPTLPTRSTLPTRCGSRTRSTSPIWPDDQLARAPSEVPSCCGPFGGHRRDHPLRSSWIGYINVNAACWAIWAVGVAGSPHHALDGLWPIWVTVPWGLAKLRARGFRFSRAGR
jgi:hypothetical protein